jgi:phosphoribosylformylglycinamidine synthase
MLGALDLEAPVGHAFVDEGDAIALLGRSDPEDFGGSEYAKVVNHAIAGRPPSLDLDAERNLHQFLHVAAGRGLLKSAHDLSDGGLAVALAESAIAGDLGFAVTLDGEEPHGALFSESPSRVVATCSGASRDELVALASDRGVQTTVLGSVGGATLDFGAFAVDLDEVDGAYESALPNVLSATMT